MKVKLIITLLLGSLLAGCVAAVVAGAAGGMVVYDRRSISTIEKDARIFHQIHTAIVRNPQLHDSRLVVSSFNQVVLLLGQTPVASSRVLAERIARDSAHAYRIYNEITIGMPLSLVQQSKDTWITGEVRSRMLTQKGLESGSIRVITENKTVYLMGIATPEQADLAVSVARQIKDVKKVVKIFQYIR
ncbi:MAG: BON domain-containing protein [Legionellaceae bacterium]|nr:BON domain-containing protein [Legionellaceae bacterium]